LNNRNQVERIKKMYPAGTRIELLSTMDDQQGVEKGTKGTVILVDDIGAIHMKWDNGRGLGLIPEEDSGEVVVMQADYDYDIADVPNFVIDIFELSGICIRELEEKLMTDNIVYGDE